MYIAGQERRLVDPPSQVVAGVRTVTTKNGWARTLPRSRPSAFSRHYLPTTQELPETSLVFRANKPYFKWKGRCYPLEGMNVTDYRSEFAAYYSSLELARYRYHAGLDSELKTAEAKDRFSDLFSFEAIANLGAHLDDVSSDRETEKAGVGRLLGRARLEYVESQVTAVTDEISRCEAASSVEWDRQRIPLLEISSRLGRRIPPRSLWQPVVDLAKSWR